jgi:hypothetical protein
MTWSFLHKFFGMFLLSSQSYAALLIRASTTGSGNCALMYSIFGGDVRDLRIWLIEERFPDHWEPKNREAFGHTILVSSQSF